MCLPEARPPAQTLNPLQALLQGEQGIGPLARLPEPGPEAGNGPQRRLKLWDLEEKLHCPVIGTCISMAELDKLAHKLGFGHRQNTGNREFSLHVEAVGHSRQRNSVAEGLQRYLDRKYHAWVERFAKHKTDAQVRAQWQDCLLRGEVAGPLWAVCTHKAASASTRQRAYEDIHMLSHQIGAGQAADAHRLQYLEQEHARLQAEHKRQEQARLAESTALQRELAQARARLLQQDAQLQTMEALQARLERFESGTAMVEMGQRLMQLQDSHDKLSAITRRMWELERNLKDAREEATRIAQERDEALTEREALEQLLHALDPQERMCMEAGSEACAGCENALSSRCILYVGGRASLMAQYRQLADRLGITLIHHDGGQEESLSRLPELIRGADVVLCPTDKISHNAYYHVKAHCKRVGKPCLFYKGGGVSGFAVAMARLSRGEFSLSSPRLGMETDA